MGAGRGVGTPAAGAPIAVDGLVDTHCHLEMLDDAPAALARASAAGVTTVITIGTDVPSSRTAISLAHRFPNVHATVGLHPHEAGSCDDALLGELEELAADERVVAIGECGLDYYRDLSPRPAQRAAFVAQIDLARRADLPLVVHVREAGDDSLALLGERAAGLTVVLHCFSLPGAIDVCVSRGYYVSLAGNVTYRHAGDLRAAAARVPDDHLLVETDAPFLAPLPNRGRRNEPGWVTYTAAVLADVRGWEARRVETVTAANARRAFRLPGGPS